jgi:cation diffusion facilitator family transporter
MINEISKEQKDKRGVALSSVFAAILLTLTKLIVGLLTRSLGILSEALHSGLDLIAALMTYFAVKYSDRPADADHHYGHGKIENLSALVETLLLLITCVWIVYEAISRLIHGNTHIEVNYWSFAVMILSIIVDFSRSRMLMKAAKKYNSQALEADALHFSTDILSSSVVIFGLFGSMMSFPIADPIAALVVAGIVIWISFKLGKKAIDILLDKSPENLDKQILELVKTLDDVLDVHDIKLRTAGAMTFVELNIHVAPNMSISEAHRISHKVENKIMEKISKCEVHVHAEPEIQ